MTIWMIGDDEIKDIKGAKDSINAIGILFQNKKTKVMRSRLVFSITTFY